MQKRCEDKRESELIALGHELEFAAIEFQNKVDAIPESASFADERAGIDAARQKPDAVAERIGAMPAWTPAGLRVKVRALQWLDGYGFFAGKPTLPGDDLYGRGFDFDPGRFAVAA
jgi:hypothetical protein